jgi:sugar porter (SP) family MFS transporter
MFFLPESPRWLASKGHWDEAEQVVESVAGVEHEEEMRAIRKSLAKGKHASIRELFFTGLCMALVVGVGLAVFQQFVGIAAISYYAPTIFKFAGFQSASGDVLATSITAIDTVIATIISIFLVDRLGRRPLLLASLLGIIITLVIISIAFAMGANKAGYLILISLLIYVLAYGLGIGPLFALICSEIFPTKLRGTAVSISLCVNWIATLLISITFLSLVKHLGEAWTFSVYAFFAVAALIFTWFLVPETKGKKLEQIEEYWEDGRHW